MDALCGRIAAGLTIDDEDLVRRAAPVSLEDCREGNDQDEYKDKDEDDLRFSHNLGY